ncbi:MAG TPA: CHASE domain-containing protein [Patescibacteria group bacterium]|jgi:CHASE1-domain containing sensor protein
MKYSNWLVKFLPLLVFVFLLLSTFLTWKITQSFAQRESDKIFQQKVNLINTAIEYRLNSLLLATDGFAGLVEGSEAVSRAEWSRAVRRVDLSAKHPGVSSVNYVEKVSSNDKQAFINELRSIPDLPTEERNQLTIFPDSNKPEYFVVKYLEPQEERASALGYDISSNEQRLQALEKAALAGHSVSTGRIELVTTQRSGFGFLTPVYSRPMDEQSTDEERLNNLEGFVYLIFREDIIFQKVLAPQALLVDLDIEIYASPTPEPQQLIFDSVPANKIPEHEGDSSQLQAMRRIKVDGTEWILLVSSEKDAHLLPSQVALPKIVLIAGLLVNLTFLATYLHFFKR